MNIESKSIFVTFRKALIVGLIVFAVSVLFYQTAWLTDQAFVTFRVVVNWLNGFGLVWNPGERVQVFSHPLWMLLLAGGQLIFGHIYFVPMTLALLLTIAFLVYSYRSLFNGDGVRFVIATLSLLASKAFVDFWWSGLENPLIYGLLAFFIVHYRKSLLGSSKREIRQLALITALIGLCGLDYLLLIGPAFIFAAQRTREPKKAAVLTGLIPLAVWLVFALIYYGWIFPNPVYTLWYSGLPLKEFVISGGLYFVNSLHYDPITLLLILLALVLGFRAQIQMKMLALGLLLYLLFVLCRGGDFMSGRLFSVPFLLAVILLLEGLVIPRVLIRGTIALALFALLWPYAPPRNFAQKEKFAPYDFSMFGDERGSFAPYTALSTCNRGTCFFNHPWARAGLELNQSDARGSTALALGLYGFAAGPEKVIIDPMALTDPFLARLPVTGVWKIGYLERAIPVNYTQSVLELKNYLADPTLHQRFFDINLITRGEILGRERLKTILRYQFLRN